MNVENPERILITGGHEIGGVDSFAQALRKGFEGHGIPVEVIAPGMIFKRWRDLRDPRVLKILSTEAVFAAPFARRAICVAHGIPRADFRYQGWRKLLGIIGSFKLANRCPGVQLVSVSNYTAATLGAIFHVKTDAVILNPVKPIYLESYRGSISERCYITYIGRLVPIKNLHRMLPAIQDLLNENQGLRACIIGDGEQRAELEAMVAGDSRFEFKGNPDDTEVLEWLRRTKVFVSGNEVEGFGITYVEAMTQGCVVAMPASGGGIEIALDKVGRSVQLLPLSWDRGEVLAILRRALLTPWEPITTEHFSVDYVVNAYLRVDSRFTRSGHGPESNRAVSPNKLRPNLPTGI